MRNRDSGVVSKELRDHIRSLFGKHGGIRITHETVHDECGISTTTIKKILKGGKVEYNSVITVCRAADHLAGQYGIADWIPIGGIERGSDLRRPGEPVLEQGPPTREHNWISVPSDFKHATEINDSRWVVNGDAAVAMMVNLTNPPAKIVSPVLVLSSEQGLSIGGIERNYEYGGIQSIESFPLPLMVRAKCTPDARRGAAMCFGVTNESGTSGVCVTCGQGGIDMFTGFVVRQPSPPQPYWEWIAKLYEMPPLPDVMYSLEIAIDQDGHGILSVSNEGRPLGEPYRTFVGTGPFYVVLAQGSGAQPLPERNGGNWSVVEVVRCIR